MPVINFQGVRELSPVTGTQHLFPFVKNRGHHASLDTQRHCPLLHATILLPNLILPCSFGTMKISKCHSNLSYSLSWRDSIITGLRSISKCSFRPQLFAVASGIEDLNMISLDSMSEWTRRSLGVKSLIKGSLGFTRQIRLAPCVTNPTQKMVIIWQLSLPYSPMHMASEVWRYNQTQSLKLCYQIRLGEKSFWIKYTNNQLVFEESVYYWQWLAQKSFQSYPSMCFFHFYHEHWHPPGGLWSHLEVPSWVPAPPSPRRLNNSNSIHTNNQSECSFIRFKTS